MNYIYLMEEDLSSYSLILDLDLDIYSAALS